jgi:hypothetical protein
MRIGMLLLAGCPKAPSETDTDATVDTEAPSEACSSPDCQACADAGYWETVQETPDDELFAALEAATDSVSCTYDSARKYLFTNLDSVDEGVECVYTGAFFPIDNYPPDWDVVNTEHTWPQSNGADLEPAKCDLHHLFPVDSTANTQRGNLPFGEVATVEWSSGGSLQGMDGAGVDVFEPRDEHKGNVARAMLYFAVRYGYTLSEEQFALFNAWDVADPTDDAEMTRTSSIQGHQGNANPFVACPGLVQRVAE